MRSSSPECVIDEYIGLVRPSSSVAKFTSLAKGISVLGSNFFADKKIKVMLFLSLQALNVLQLKEILEYTNRWPFDFDWHFVHTPAHLCISNLHPNVKEQAFDMLDTIDSEKIDLAPIYKLLKVPYVKNEWETLLDWLKLHEKHHNQTLYFKT